MFANVAWNELYSLLRHATTEWPIVNALSKGSIYSYNKKHLKNVGPIHHCEPLHALILHCHLPGVATVARLHGRTPPAHRCPRRQQRQRVTEGTAIWPHGMGPIRLYVFPNLVNFCSVISEFTLLKRTIIAAIRPQFNDDLHSSRWRFQTEWKIAILISAE